MAERTQHDECYTCGNRRSIEGDAHIKCDSPDPDMTGHKIGIKGGWFAYPWNFDPAWKTKMCVNFDRA